VILILQRYLLRDLVKVFLLALVGVSAVMVVLMMGQLIGRGVVSGEHALKALPLFLPVVLAYTVPATVLFAATLVYGRFARDNEFDAVRMSGIHPLVIVVPSVVVATVLSCAVLYFAAELIPRSYYRVRNLSKNVEVAKDAFFRQLDQSGTWGDSVWTIWTGSVKGDTAYGVRIEKRNSETRKPELIVQAGSATFRFDPDNEVVEVRARQAKVETFGAGGATRAELRDTHVQRFPLVPTPPPRPKDLPLGLLLRRLAEQPNPGDDADDLSEEDLNDRALERQEMRTEVHLRLNLAVSSLSLVLVGVPLAIWFRRGHMLAAFLVALGPMLLFHLTTFMTKNLSQTGTWPAAAPWLANGLLWMFAAVLLWRLFRR